MLDLGIYIIISALVGAKLLLLVTDFRTFTDNPRELLDAGALGRRVLRRADPRRRRRAVVHPARRPAALDDLRRLRAGHRARPRRRPVRLLLRRLLLRQADDVPWAITFTDPFAAANVGTPLNVPLHPTQLYEAGAEALILVAAARDRIARPARSRAGRSGSTCCSTRSRASSSRSSAATRAARVGMFSTSQFISLVLAPLAVVMLVYLGATRAAGAEGRAQGAPEPRARMLTLTVADDSDGVRLDRFLVVGAGRALALADPAADQGRPRPGRRARRPRPNQPVKAGQTVARRRARADRRRRRSPKRCRCRSSTRTPTSSSSTSRPAWSCIRRRATRAARW